MNKFNVGDKVFTLQQGYGKVTEINKSVFYPITVVFDTDNIETFSTRGYAYTNDKHATLYIEGDTSIITLNKSRDIELYVLLRNVLVHRTFSRKDCASAFIYRYKLKADFKIITVTGRV